MGENEINKPLPRDVDWPKSTAPKFVKPLSQVVSEFHEKSDYLLTSPEVAELDLEEIDMREFIEWIFERRIGSDNLVLPFEDRQSNEYKNWKEQKKERRKQIDYKGYACWRYSPIVYYKEDGKNCHWIIFNDDEECLSFLEQRQFALLSPVTYVGRNNTAVNARYLYALSFDLDGVGTRQIKKLCWMIRDNAVPMPNLITNSGHGLHLHYILEKPVPLYQENITLLNKLKHGLTNIIWNEHTSTETSRQHQGILQGFRLPGTLTKFGEKIRAFHSMEAPFHTIEQLNNYLDLFRLTDEEIKKLWKQPFYDPTGVTREEAARRWPEWYARKIIEGKRSITKWHVNRAVYDWWLNRLWNADKEIQIHHRYWCILTLVVYAVKCDIPRDEVLQDAYSLVPKLDTYTDTEDNHFTTQDVDDAMRAYDEEYCTWPINTIETTTLFRIERNRRNGRNQEAHLKRARAVQMVDDPDGSWRKGNGRKRVYDKVQKWKEEHPGNENKSLCARELGLTRPTVRKWWNGDFIETSQTKAEKPKEKIVVYAAELFAPGSTYTIEGYSHEEVVEAFATGRWQQLGWILAI